MAHRYDLLPVDQPLVASSDREGFTPAEQSALMLEVRRASNQRNSTVRRDRFDSAYVIQERARDRLAADAHSAAAEPAAPGQLEIREETERADA